MIDELIIKTFESIGIPKMQTTVYLDLLKNKESTATEIAKRTKIHRANVYNLLTKLKERNLIYLSNKEGASITKTKNGEMIKITFVDNKTRLESNNVKVKTELPMEVEGNIIRVTQSNGIKSEIKVMPVVASETAIARLGIKFCNETNNCTIVLKEVGVEKNFKLAYQVKAQKDVKILGLFKAKMNVEANVDAETGKVISEHKPWWSFLAKKQNK